ncbi:glycosyltransferase [Paraburkholderia sp. UYCP14C]|uniref:glycosyltransferase n=1 Tax=Paraburkholderia sp. UYCP14C TaxID=2511130 RepID=UPI0010224B2E|nr:glycosyltransferase [Paraburkholderia sp. UYCP14C]RZF24858.1 glycosyltransferase [Paraburkholderia sp. UYCP14C]
MRTLHIISSIERRYGGPAEALKRLAAELRLSGHTVDIVCLDSTIDADKSDDNAFDLVVRLGHHAGKYMLNFRLVGWLAQHAKQYDAIIVDGIWQFHSAAAVISLLPKRIPYFVMPHGMLDPWFNIGRPLKHAKKLAYWMFVERHVISNAKGVLFTTESERELARLAFPLYRATEVMMMIGTAPPPSTETVDIAERDSPAKPGKKVILFLGRIHEKKGCDLLIRSFHDLGNLSADYRLVVAGPDDHGLGARLRREAVRLGIADRISWPGMVTGAHKWSLLRAADVMVLPSHQENFGVVVAEALACGVPVLLTDKVGIWQEIVADRAGFVDDDTREGITRLLTQWIKLAEDEKVAMRCSAKQCFNNRFHISRVAQSYIALVSKQIGQASLL